MFPTEIPSKFLLFLIQGPKSGTVQHESMHSILRILGVPEKRPEKIRDSLKEEFFAQIGAYRILGAPVGGPKGVKFQHKVNEFYRNYGVDGVLALFAYSEKIKKWQDIDELENMLLHKKMLSMNGFSEKGVEWLKSIAPSSAIEARLQRIDANRKEQKLRWLKME